MKLRITKKLVNEINRLLSFGLVRGGGMKEEGKMCVEEVVNCALNLPTYNDNPIECVAEEVASAKRWLNDRNWSSNRARAEGLKYLAVAQLGSNTIDGTEFLRRFKSISNRKVLPFMIRQREHVSKDELKCADKFETLEENQFDAAWTIFYAKYHDYYCYHKSFTSDKFLSLVADAMLEALKELKSPGCKYLHWVK